MLDDHAPILDPKHMVSFDENDTFHAREVWDERYNETFNSSAHDYTMEISGDRKSAGVRMECGDPITDHIISHMYHGFDMEPIAIANNMSLTNWTPPPGWHLPSGVDYDGKKLHEVLEDAYFFPVNASYATWGESRTSGVSRWALRIDAKTGPFYLGAAVPPFLPAGVEAKRLTSPAWGISHHGFSFHSDGSGNRSERDLIVTGQIGVSCWPPYFGQDALVWMVLDRDEGTLQFTVNSLPPFALYGVHSEAVPFVCTQMPGDGITLLSMHEAILQMPTNLRNDIVCRWSITNFTLPPLKTRKAKKSKAKSAQIVVDVGGGNNEESEIIVDTGPDAAWYNPRPLEFWPGGRLKGPEFEGEERILEDLEAGLSEEDLQRVQDTVTNDRYDDFTNDHMS